MRRQTPGGRGDSGFVLIVMLVVLSGLSLFVLGIAHRSRLDLRVAQYRYEQASLRELAEAGIALACARLRADNDDADYLAEPWHSRLVVDSLLWGSADNQSEAAGRSIEVTCVDEESKLNLLGISAADLEDLCGGDADMADAILEWMGPDEGGTAAGAYEREGVPYQPKHAAPEHPVELLLVEGVDSVAYYGEDANRNGLLDDNENDGARSYPLDDGDGKLRMGLRDLVTTYGDGRVNVNTASLEVLSHIAGLGEQAAAEVIKWRRGTDGVPATVDDSIVRSWDDLSRIPGLTDVERSVIAGSCTVRSQFFSITSAAVGSNGRHRYEIELVVQRSGSRLTPILRKEAWGDPRASAYRGAAGSQ